MALPRSLIVFVAFMCQVAAYVLTELPSDSARAAATQALYELLSEGCVVLRCVRRRFSHTFCNAVVA
jgi:hypothetical protein